MKFIDIDYVSARTSICDNVVIFVIRIPSQNYATVTRFVDYRT